MTQAPGTTTPGPDESSMAGMIHISSFEFTVPQSVTAGSTVTVMNMDDEAHTVTSDTGKVFDAKVPPGGSVTLTAPSKPGTYPFHCTFHSNMQGSLVVT